MVLRSDNAPGVAESGAVVQQSASDDGVIDSNGGHIFYQVQGAGQPLILLHAGIADSRMWDAQVPEFTQHYRVVRYDRRGFGRTTVLPGSFSHVEDLRALLGFLNIDRALFVGCSQGGTVAVDFALQHPEMVDALVLVTAAPSGLRLGAAPAGGWGDMEAAYRAGDFRLMSEIEVRMWVDGPQRGPDEVDASIRDMVREMNEIALRNEEKIGEEREAPPAVERLHEIRAPTFVMIGELDQPGMIAAGELLADRVANARHVVMPRVAHLPSMERPAEFNALILDFFSSLTN